MKKDKKVNELTGEDLNEVSGGNFILQNTNDKANVTPIKQQKKLKKIEENKLLLKGHVKELKDEESDKAVGGFKELEVSVKNEKFIKEKQVKRDLEEKTFVDKGVRVNKVVY